MAPKKKLKKKRVYKSFLLSEIKPHPRNARIHDKKNLEAIKASLAEFGQVRPIIVCRDQIIAGCGTWLAAKELGWERLEARVCDDLNELRARAYSATDNKTSDLSRFDEEELTKLFEDIYADKSLLASTGFAEYEIEPLMEAGRGESEGDDDKVPSKPKRAKSKLHEVYKIGNHVLMCGSATDPALVGNLMGTDQACLYLTDPPYNVAYVGKTADALTIENDQMDDAQFRSFLVDAFRSADSVMQNGAAFYIFHADSEGYNFRGSCRDTDWQVRQCLIWNKNTMVMGRQDYHWKHEPILYGWKGGAGHEWHSDRRQVTVLDFDRPSRSTEHPTMKPVNLISYLMTNSSPRGGIILDTFGGSGSTLIACEKLGRVCRMMELDPVYCDIIRRRWCQFVNGDEKNWQTLTPAIGTKRKPVRRIKR